MGRESESEYNVQTGSLLTPLTFVFHRMTTPLTLLSRAHIIAASVYAIAWATLKSQSLADTLFRLTTAIGDEWEEAFVPQDGVKPVCKNGDFGRDTRGQSALTHFLGQVFRSS